MKISSKFILATTSVGILSLGVDLQTVYAIKPQSQVKILPQTHSSTQVAEPSDGDGEENDATEAPDLVKQPHRTNSIVRHNDAKKALEGGKHNQSHTATNFNTNNQDDGGYDAPNDADSTHEDAH